ncbi:MAG: hypothetical protein PWQ51_2129, partial [Methanolobus sp.]|nr:hypothetical protein [Methanolobus sp.]
MKCAYCDDKMCRDGKDCAGITDDISYEGNELKSMKTSAAIEARHYM